MLNACESINVNRDEDIPWNALASVLYQAMRNSKSSVANKDIKRSLLIPQNYDDLWRDPPGLLGGRRGVLGTCSGFDTNDAMKGTLNGSERSFSSSSSSSSSNNNNHQELEMPPLVVPPCPHVPPLDPNDRNAARAACRPAPGPRQSNCIRRPPQRFQHNNNVMHSSARLDSNTDNSLSSSSSDKEDLLFHVCPPSSLSNISLLPSLIVTIDDHKVKFLLDTGAK